VRIFAGKPAQRKVIEIANRATQSAGIEVAVARIVKSVRSGGDQALRRYARKWDGLGNNEFRVGESEIKAARESSSVEFRKALKQAAANIRQFCEWQKPKEWQRSTGGISVGQIVRPLESVGCYVPGGRYPLVSTLLMTVIPAQVAGVKNIRVVSPQPRSEVLAAAAFLEVKEFYRIGGAQAIAALSYGTETVGRVDKIVGPGNSYVTAAKKLVSFDCAIDFLAGPTEVLIVSENGKPEFIAADLVAQAEHDPEALAVFITSSGRLAKDVTASVKRLAAGNRIAKQSLTRRGAILLAESHVEALAWANLIASEHITISKDDLPDIQNAGSVFIGDYSPQAAGDYASGPNHVLPTAGVARFRGGLSVYDFVKLITVQELSSQGLRSITPTVVNLAETEGLQAHADSIRARFANA
jgi:histidinol dehydrogenase